MRSKKIRLGLLLALLSTGVGGASMLLDGEDAGTLPGAQAALRRQSPRLPPQARMAALSAMPLAFVENRGQADARAAFLVQGRDTTAWFTAQGMTLALTQAAAGKSAARQRWNLKLDFVGANPAARPIGKDSTRAQVSYFNGPPDQWHTGIRSYARIVYPNLWPGIDLVYSGTDNRLKYEFIVKPGADPQRIKLAWRGTNAPLTVNAQGELELATPFGTLRDERPVARQGKRKSIPTQFVVSERAADGAQGYGFKLGKYDRHKPLIIDPAIQVYAGFIGGSGDDEGHAIAADRNGYAYVTGVTTSAQASFPETAGPDLSYNGRTDAFVAKLKTDGSGLVYAGYIGGDGDDAGHGIAVDANGNAYVTGWTNSTQATFPVLGALDPTFNGAIDAFVAKVNAAGTALSYCGYLGGDDEDEGLGIAVDTMGRAYVTGLTASTEATFPKLIGPGLLFKGAVDAFVARVKADGSGLDYAGYLGGSGDDQGRGIAVDAGGNAYVAGLTTSTQASFPMVGALDPSFNGGTDAFVAKLNATGAAVTYSGFIGGNGIDEAYGIAIDGAGNAYVTGRTNSTEATFPELGGPDLTFNGALDAFAAKINAAGSALSYAGYIGGGGDDEGFGIAVDNAGNAVVTGRTTSSAATFPAANAFDATLNGAADGFIAKVNPAGNAFIFAGYLGGNGLEEGFGAAVNGLRQAYVAGRSTSADNFPALLGPALNFGGAADAFVMRIDDTSVICATLTISPATLPGTALGASYNQAMTVTGGSAPYSFTIINGAPPPGLGLSLTGVLSGTASQTGTFNFTVSATDTVGCTGTLAYAITISPANNPPTINPVLVSRQQGSPVSNSTIANVTDPDQTLNTLAVTVNGGATATVNGVTVSGISVSAAGVVTANVVASCTATTAMFTLTVTDNTTATANTILPVTVTANTGPTLTYANQSMAAGSALMINPTTGPSDNGSVNTIALLSQGTYTGTISVNNATGVVSISNAAPVGNHTITIRATDNCGATTNTTFTLFVDTAPTISTVTNSRAIGSTTTNSQIATVTDPDQSLNTLTVQVNNAANAMVNGVTVSNIAVSAGGVVTADIGTTCAATNATFTLKVTDNLNLMNTAPLPVNVTANSLPTLGTYPAAGPINTGASTTVTPNAAPADNGSVVSVTASAPGFTGTFNGNPTTGVVTIGNAGPVGNYTVTVTATDNCGATTNTTFPLLVDTAPTITPVPNARALGSTATNSQIATVTDPDQALNTLTVQVNNAASATVNGVTASNLSVTASGVVNADIATTCGATNATFTLKVTDNLNLMDTAPLTVNVTANTAPLLSGYPPKVLPVGGSGTVTPNSPPSDNGSVVSLTASATGFTGTFSGNAATGVITISNAGPAGNYPVTVTAIDNCGATTTVTGAFVLSVGAQTITVNTTADTVAADGFCSLREAITAANTNLPVNECPAGVIGPDSIVFSPGATPTINVTSALPTITEPLLLDGGATRVELNGGGLGANVPGLNITAGNSTIRGLVINRFTGAGLQITAAGGNTIQNCLIGLNAAGLAALPNVRGGIVINTANNTIGGTVAGTRNVIAGNTLNGVEINGAGATGNQVLGNFIGTDVNGALDLGNTLNGVSLVGAPGNFIGGTTAEARNLIAGNNSCGVNIEMTAASGNQVLGNFIGTNANGTAAIPNNTAGVCLDNAPNNLVGGPAAGARNLISGNSNDGVRILNAGATSNLIQGNLIGTNAAGSGALGNTFAGVRISDAPNNTIGGTAAGARNIISGNSVGVSLVATGGNQVLGNFIGTNANGTAAVPNQIGVARSGSGTSNSIGGTAPGAGNVISGNQSVGVQLQSQGDSVLGNLIGTNAAGTAALGNLIGVSLNAATANINTIGGTTAGARNVVAGNLSDGVLLGGGAVGNNVLGNFIGVNQTGDAAVPNGGHGVNIDTSSSNNTIGGRTPEAENVIANNGGSGVRIFAATSVGNQVLRNRIFNNGGANGALGIDLGAAGVTANDLNDGDTGPNGLQNFPILTAALTLGAGPGNTTAFQGTLNSAAGTLFRIEFFSNAACDASGNGEGRTFLGFTNVTTNSGGNANIRVTLPTPTGITAGDFVTATATDVLAKNTSEFSPCVPVFSFAPAAAAFTRNAATGSFGVFTAAGVNWTAMSTAPWLTVTGNPSGTGNGTVNYALTANPEIRLRTGTISVNGNLFIVTQTGTTGTIILEDFAGVTFQPGANWTIIDGGTGGGIEARWTNQNPCNRSIPAPFISTFAIMDAGCAGPTVSELNEFLSTPPFNATGLGTVVVEFFNQFQFNSATPNNKGEVDVSINGGLTWTNVLLLQGQDFGVPTPETRRIDISAAVVSNPANILVRMRYSGNGAPMSAPSEGLTGRNQKSPSGEQFAFWAVDFTICGYDIGPLSANFTASGGTGGINITPPPPAPNQNPRPWAAVSNAPWITNLTPLSGNGNGTVSYSVAANPDPMSRTGTVTVTGDNNFVGIHTVTQASGCAAITITPATLPNAQQGASYNQPLAATPTGTYTFSVTTGTPPTGITLTDGVLSGTPSVNGDFTFTVTATNTANQCAGTRQFTLTVCPLVTITPNTLPNGTVGTAYPQQIFTATPAPPNGTLAWSATGNVPLGLNVSATGLLTGTPTTAGSFTFTVTATGGTAPMCAASRPYTVTINPAGNGLQFYPLARPLRLLDTRPDQSLCDNVGTPITGGTALTTQARITCNGLTIPANAQAIVGNVTVINQTASFGFLTLFPAGQTLPLAANIIYEPGQLLSNNFTVGLNTNGEFSTFAERTLHTVIDVSGYFAPPTPTGLFYHALPRPLRLLDTRADQSLCDNVGLPITGGTALTTQARINCNGITIPNSAQAIVGNATVINQTASFGFMTLFPAGQTLPLAANMIYAPNQLLANAFTVGLSAGGQFDTFAERTLHLVIDVAGYYSTEASDANGPGLLFNPLPRPLRLLDTRADQNLCDNVGAPIAAGTALTTQARITCNGITIPTAAQAVSGNITVINQTASFGFLTLFPAGQTLPLAANLIYAPGQLLSNAFVVGLSGLGEFNTFGERTIHVVIDVSGYFAP